MENVKIMDEKTRLRWGFAIAAVLILAVLLSAINGRITRLEKKRAARESDIAEMLILKARFQEASNGAQKLANRLATTRPDDSPAKIIEESGIKVKNAQIRPLKGEDRPGFVEDTAEVKMEGLSANEAVNLLFKLEKGVKPVIVKKALIKTRFDDPARLDLTLPSHWSKLHSRVTGEKPFLYIAGSLPVSSSSSAARIALTRFFISLELGMKGILICAWASERYLQMQPPPAHPEGVADQAGFSHPPYQLPPSIGSKCEPPWPSSAPGRSDSFRLYIRLAYIPFFTECGLHPGSRRSIGGRPTTSTQGQMPVPPSGSLSRHAQIIQGNGNIVVKHAPPHATKPCRDDCKMCNTP